MSSAGKVVKTGKIAHINLEKDYALIIDQDRCKGCALCIEVCPNDVLVLGDFNYRGYRTSEVVNFENCIKCRRCERICPDFAIYIIEKVKDQNWAQKE